MDSLSSLSRELVDTRRISSELHGAIRPPSQRPGVSSHWQRFAAASAGPSVSRRRPYDFASGQPTSNSSGRSFRPDKNSSDDERESSAGRLLPDEEEGDKENCRPASLALLLDYIMSKFPAASRPLARPSNRLPDENSSDHGHDSSAGLLHPDEEEGDEENCLPASLALLLDCIMSKFPVAPKPSLPPDDFMSSGLRASYRGPLRGLPISPGLTMFNSPVHPLSRSLRRESMRGNRYPRLCPQSQRS